MRLPPFFGIAWRARSRAERVYVIVAAACCGAFHSSRRKMRRGGEIWGGLWGQAARVCLCAAEERCCTIAHEKQLPRTKEGADMAAKEVSRG